ncbi:hypothetical protein EHO58_13780 [Leptospira selangorensis]|nr:hypothetical protein EHO58_13780 [Leptospira selangorensis]
MNGPLFKTPVFTVDTIVKRLSSLFWMTIVIQNIFRSHFMPMIDVYAPNDLFPPEKDRQLGEKLTRAVLRAEGVTEPGPLHLQNTAAYIHKMQASSVQTAADALAKTVRVQVITPPGVLNRNGQKQLVKEITEIVVEISSDPSQASRTWVLLTEAAEGGWGIAGTAFGKEEFAALAAKAAAAK